MFKLLFQRNFGSLNVAQFVTVFNDNALKQSYLLITVKMATEVGGEVGYEDQAYATILFSIPFLLLSGFAGRFTDWISKRTVVVGAKFAELLIMGIATCGFAMESRPILLVALLLLAVQSTFFSPAKYGILPEMLPREKLSAANGLLQTTSYLAILVGTAFAGFMLEYFKEERIWVGAVLSGMAAGAWLISMLLDDREPADPDKSLYNGIPLSDELSSLSWIIHRRYLFLSIVGYAYVWMVGTVLLFNINVYGIGVLGLGTNSTAFLIILLSIGLGAGCLLAGLLSGERIEAGLVPVGAFGMGIALTLFLFEPSTMTYTAAILVIAGFFGGFFLIPLQTLIQELPEKDRKGEALGIANVITFTGVIVSSVLYVVAVGQFELSATHLMVLSGVFTIVTGGIIVYLVPRFLIRFFLFALNCTLVRTHVDGHERIPGSGSVLLFAEGMPSGAPLFIDYAVDRPVRFVRYGSGPSSYFLSFLFGLMHVTELKGTGSNSINRARDEIQSGLRDGEVVCLVTGTRNSGSGEPDEIFTLVNDLEATASASSVVTVTVDGVEQSVFGSDAEGGVKAFLKRVPAPVTVTFGTSGDDK